MQGRRDRHDQQEAPAWPNRSAPGLQAAVQSRLPIWRVGNPGGCDKRTDQGLEPAWSGDDQIDRGELVEWKRIGCPAMDRQVSHAHRPAADTFLAGRGRRDAPLDERSAVARSVVPWHDSTGLWLVVQLDLAIWGRRGPEAISRPQRRGSIDVEDECSLRGLGSPLD